MKTLIAVICLAGLLPVAFAQDKIPPRVSPTDAKNYVGKTATVCGKVVDANVGKNAIRGYGFPVTFDLDQPEANSAFYFIAFGTESGGPDEAVAAYRGKHVCVTGKINAAPSGGLPFILAAHRSQIKRQAEAK